MNKKALSVLAILMLFCASASAQQIKATFGITGGGIATQMMTEPAPSSPLTFSGYGGAFATVGFKNIIGLQTGANFLMTGSAYEMSGVAMKTKQQYIQIPVVLQLTPKSWFTFEAGLYQNILFNSSFEELGSENVLITPDIGALKYNFGALGGLRFNFGRVVFMNFRYHYGLSKAYVIQGTGFPQGLITAGLGFNIISTRKSAF